MKTLRVGALLTAVTLSVASLQAQTADEIVSKHIEAIGGKTAIAGVKSVYMESSFEVMGNTAPSTTYIVTGKGYRNDVDFNGTKIIQCVNDKGGWGVNPMAGQSTPTAMPAEQVKAGQAQLQVGGPLFDYATKGYKITLIGKDTAGGTVQYKIKLSGIEGADYTYYIDGKTYYITKALNKTSIGGADQEVEIDFSNYKKLDNGYVMAFGQAIVLPQMTINITHNKIELNKPVDLTLFDMPKS